MFSTLNFIVDAYLGWITICAIFAVYRFFTAPVGEFFEVPDQIVNLLIFKFIWGKKK